MFESRKHGENAREVFRARAAAILLLSAHDQGCDKAPGRAFKKADSFGTAKLMGATSQPIGLTETGAGHFAEPLGGVAEELNLGAPAKIEDLFPGLKRSNFIVGGHHRNESWMVARKLARKPVEVHHACW